MARYHSDDYVSFLASIRPDNQQDHQKEMVRCEWYQCDLCGVGSCVAREPLGGPGSVAGEPLGGPGSVTASIHLNVH